MYSTSLREMFQDGDQRLLKSAERLRVIVQELLHRRQATVAIDHYTRRTSSLGLHLQAPELPQNWSAHRRPSQAKVDEVDLGFRMSFTPMQLVHCSGLMREVLLQRGQQPAVIHAVNQELLIRWTVGTCVGPWRRVIQWSGTTPEQA